MWLPSDTANPNEQELAQTAKTQASDNKKPTARTGKQTSTATRDELETRERSKTHQNTPHQKGAQFLDVPTSLCIILKSF